MPGTENGGTADDQPDGESRRLYDEEYLHVFRAVLEYAQIAIRSVILVNGAAATALLAFLGSDAAAKLQGKELLFNSLVLFALGVFFGVAASVFAYLSQFTVVLEASRNNYRVKLGVGWLRIAGMMSVIISITLFIFGVFVVSGVRVW